MTKAIAFSASTNGQYDLWIAPAAGGAARRVTSLAGDERWPSWARDGRLVFAGPSSDYDRSQTESLFA